MKLIMILLLSVTLVFSVRGYCNYNCPGMHMQHYPGNENRDIDHRTYGTRFSSHVENQHSRTYYWERDHNNMLYYRSPHENDFTPQLPLQHTNNIVLVNAMVVQNQGDDSSIVVVYSK